MPGPCQRIRLPSLVTVIRSPKPDCSPVRIKEQHRVVMMGSARVGKSSIISQFLYDKYLSRYRQTVEELHRGEYELDDGSALTLDILDTSGAYQFPAMRALSISTGGAFILVFAVDEEESWKEVERLRNQVNCGWEWEIILARVPCLFIGNVQIFHVHGHGAHFYPSSLSLYPCLSLVPFCR